MIVAVGHPSFVGPASWTPTDGSGAGLTLTVNGAQYVKIGRLGILTFDVTYPSTADTSAAKLAGIPATLAGYSATLGQSLFGLETVVTGGAINGGAVTLANPSGATQTLQLFTGNGGGSTVGNDKLSGARIRGGAIVLTAA